MSCPICETPIVAGCIHYPAFDALPQVLDAKCGHCGGLHADYQCGATPARSSLPPDFGADVEAFRAQIEKEYEAHPTGCGGSFGEILCWEIHSNGQTFLWLATKWGISVSFLGEVIADHCRKMEGSPKWMKHQPKDEVMPSEAQRPVHSDRASASVVPEGRDSVNNALPPDFGKLMWRLNEAGARGNCNCADLAQDGRTCEFHKSYIALEAAIASLGPPR